MQLVKGVKIWFGKCKANVASNGANSIVVILITHNMYDNIHSWGQNMGKIHDEFKFVSGDLKHF